MFPNRFEYRRPGSLAEAVQILAENPDAKLLAGGHSLLPAMKLRLAAPSTLVDLSQIEGLRGIAANGALTIGALATYNQVHDSAAVRQAAPMLADTCGIVGDPQVRVRGTLGGSLAHADPAADLTAVVLALGGEVTVVGSGGERTIAADDLFVDLLTTSLAPEEIITEIRIPDLAGAKMAYEKHEHPASGYAVVGVAAVLAMGDGGTIRSARLAVTGATAKATRLSSAEAVLAGKTVRTETIAAAAAAAADGLEINGDLYASADYRRHLVGVLTRRALERATG
ncbi:MAG: Aerobic carbon monoxide dehydrogenase (quinone), medium chain [uncultured Thermomicrobiales bacterium]|uniref:Aerobic carbon monoxide dehydrogenase (Quinone), medium chain n=1 Tax=uncultured Thermomicrobiales bacterium TaxID=1645740 RepID=A0A6J4UWF8_9BACT|nr:MAG: Aerobic carbon monoxide dehydrogenase (quinone), medium chain [uncultured Thermomicrobiales bacterium]